MLYTFPLAPPQHPAQIHVVFVLVEMVQWTNIKNYKFIHFSAPTSHPPPSLFLSCSIPLPFLMKFTPARSGSAPGLVAPNNNPPLLTSKSLFTQMKVFRLKITSNYSAFNRTLSFMHLFSVLIWFTPQCILIRAHFIRLFWAPIIDDTYLICKYL